MTKPNYIACCEWCDHAYHNVPIERHGDIVDCAFCGETFMVDLLIEEQPFEAKEGL